MGGPVALLGDWRFDRVVTDRLAGSTGTVAGSMRLALDPDGRVRWTEQGVLSLDGREVPVSRTLYVAPRGADWMVTFADGRDFHPWAPGAEVVHPCAADTYRGTVTLLTADRWHVRWDCTGPAKDYTLETTITR